MMRSLSEASTSASSRVDEVRKSREALIEDVRRHSYSPEDLEILTRFLDLQLLDGHEALATEPPKVLLRLVLRAMKLLHYCNFEDEDICCVLAHASVYFRSTHRACGPEMDGHELANAMVALMYIAHCYVEDEICPLRVWHEHIFQKYCSVETLNSVIFRLMEIRGHRLRVHYKEMTQRYEFLCGSTTLSSVHRRSTDPETTKGV